jgi:hypothetical protein
MDNEIIEKKKRIFFLKNTAAWKKPLTEGCWKHQKYAIYIVKKYEGQKRRDNVIFPSTVRKRIYLTEKKEEKFSE